MLVAAVNMILVTAATYPATAGEASEWDGDNRSAARLISGAARREEGTRLLRAGIEFKLGSGWKMYWRYPGDAGIPPRFDFAGSKNVSDVTVLWPAPKRFSEDGTHLIVYEGHFVLPLRIVPNDPDMPVILRLKLDYGICEKLCIPAEANSELVVSGQASIHELAIADAEQRVPKKVEIGGHGPFSIRAVRRELGTTPWRIVVDVVAAEGASIHLFAEGPTPDWALPVPQQISAEAGSRRFAFDLSGVPPGVNPKGAVLRLTAVMPQEAIEVSAPIE